MSNKIKKPMNAYMFLVKKKEQKLFNKKPELKSKVAEVAKLIGNHWKKIFRFWLINQLF